MFLVAMMELVLSLVPTTSTNKETIMVDTGNIWGLRHTNMITQDILWIY